MGKGSEGVCSTFTTILIRAYTIVSLFSRSASETDQERDGEEGGAVTEELYDDIKQQAPPPLPQKAPPSQPQKALPPPPPPPKPPGPPTVRPPSIPFTAEEEEEMEREVLRRMTLADVCSVLCLWCWDDDCYAAT